MCSSIVAGVMASGQGTADVWYTASSKHEKYTICREEGAPSILATTMRPIRA
jgi:hypothetical protein